MELREMRFIIEIEKYGSITDASRHLYIPQPTISNALKRVEEELDQVLFYRTSTGMEITNSGKRFVEIAKQIVELRDKIYSEMSPDNQKERIFRIGISSYLGEHLLPSILYKIKSTYPDIVFDLVIKTSSVLEEMLKADDLDISILSQPRSVTGLDYELLCKEDLLLALPPSYEFKNGTGSLNNGYVNFSIKDMHDFSFILPEKGHAIRDYVDMFLRSNNITYRISAICPSLPLTHRLVVNGLGAGFIPRHFADNSTAQIRPIYCTVHEMIPEWSIIIVKNKKHNPISDKIIKLLKETCNCETPLKSI